MVEVFGLTLKTKLSGETLERLLAIACRTTPRISFEGSEQTESGPKKIVRIAFENPDDRERFRGQLRKLAASAPGDAQSSKTAGSLKGARQVAR